ncbi:trigger factor-related chaperone, partial [Mycoplasma tauri]|uniref:trigger factor-related chaperone n=1 Tax=Mycoplasma tauri TaxID=547987 RepID=UPI001CBD855B
MINYKTKVNDLNILPNEWESEKAKTMMDLASKGQKLTIEQIEELTLNKFVQNAVDSTSQELLKENFDIIMFPPIITVEDIARNNKKINITITYYLVEDVDKIQFTDLNMNFSYKPVPQEFLKERFEKMIQDYPILEPFEGTILEGDVIEWSGTRSLNGQIVARDDNVAVQVNKSDSYSINSELLGKKVGETFTTTAPDGVIFNITIHSGKRPTRVKLDDSNVKYINIPGVMTLEDLKNKVNRDTIKKNATNELLRYYEETIDLIMQKNEIEINNFNINKSTSEIVNQLLAEINDANEKEKIAKEIENQTDEGNKIIEGAIKRSIIKY